MSPTPTSGLRAEVLLLGSRLGTTRRFPPMLHVGTPGGTAVDIDPLGDFDLGLRIDVVGAALDVIDEPHPCVWITRCGPTHLTDLDQLWCPAATTALTARGFAPAFYAVTRTSWTCALSGRTRVWSRPPQRRSRA